ncbi:MAG TPA: hypothetical protein DCY20_02415 [Firmicutes bacterium]|nr:hypothetical protein [Bacillota bacterium]
MNKNMKKIIVSVVAVLLVGLAIFMIPGMTRTQGEKEIFITVKNEETGEVLLDAASYHTDTETLGDFLAEHEEDFKMEMEDSEYGRFINGMFGLTTEDMMNGPWWMYAYNSPSQELEMPVGQAPGVDTLTIQDQDEVIFVFTTDMGF